MIPRICLQKDLRSSKAEPCSAAELLAVMRDPKVQEICDNIKTLQNGEQYDKELIAGYKKRLPAITPHACKFEGNRRNNKNATPSGLVMLDVDHVESPDAWFKSFMERSEASRLESEKVYLIAKTPSGHGLRIIAERDCDASLGENQQRLASLFSINQFDACTKDLARLSYVMPYSYVYYFNPNGFEWADEEEAKKVWDKLKIAEQKDLFAESMHEGAAATGVVSDPFGGKEYPLEYNGIPYSSIVKELIEIHGGQPQFGERNNMYFTLAIDMRYICDFNAQHIQLVLPDFGLPTYERANVIKSALSRPRRSNLPFTIERALVVCKQNAESEKKIDFENIKADEVVLPARLPRLFQVITRNLPDEYRAAMLIASLPVLGALATRVRFKYLDGQVHSFSFLSCITAPAATGKSFIRQPIDLLLTPINEQDEVERKKDQEYKEKLRACRNKKDQPEDPHACPRNNGINVSVAALLKLMSYSGEKHMIAIGEEIDTLAKSEKAGVWSQKSDIYRLAFDNATYGQQYISEQSFSANVHVYYNLLITGTPGGMYKFFKNVEDGLVTRVAFATLPDMFGTSIPMFKPYSDAEREYIIDIANRLDKEGGEVECPALSEALSNWQEEKRKYAVETDSRAVDIVRRRSGVIGFRAGMLAYVIDEKRGAQQAAEFGLWVAEYVFRQQLALFGKQFEEAFTSTTEKVESNKGAVQNLLQILPQNFTSADLLALRRKTGQSVSYDSIRKVLSRWKNAGLIQPQGQKQFVKIGKIS